MATDYSTPVQFLGPTGLDDGHGSDNFQHIPARPNSWPTGAVMRSPLYPAAQIAQGQVGAPAPGAAVPSMRVYDPGRFANIISLVAGGAGSVVGDVLLLPRNDVKRNLLIVRNTSGGTQVVYLNFGQPASINSTLAIPAGITVLLDAVVPQDDIHINGSAAGWAASLSYSTIPNSQNFV